MPSPSTQERIVVDSCYPRKSKPRKGWWIVSTNQRERSRLWIMQCALTVASELNMQVEVGWRNGDFEFQKHLHIRYQRKWHPTPIRNRGFAATDPGSQRKLKNETYTALRKIRDGG